MADARKAELAVVIVNYHSSAYLEQCLRSIRATAGNLLLEIVVVDNGSCDGQLVALMTTYPEVRWLLNERNVGFVAANNQGIAASGADYLLMLNPDTELRPGALESMLRYLRQDASCGAVGPQLLYPDGARQNSHFSFPGVLSLSLESLAPARLMEFLQRVKAAYSRKRQVDVVRGTCLMIARRTFERVGGLNRKLFMFSEETDLCYRVRKLNLRCIFLPEAQVVHHESRSMRAAPDDFVLYHYFRSRIIFLREQYPRRRAEICVGIVRAGLEARKAAFRLFPGKDRYRKISALLEKLEPILRKGESA